MSSPWKAISDDNRREILLLLEKKDMIPTEVRSGMKFHGSQRANTEHRGQYHENPR